MLRPTWRRTPAGVLPRRLIAAAPAALLVALMVLPARPGASQDAGVAQGDAQVIAQGLTAPPAGRVSWRVLSEAIPPRVEARPSNRMSAAAGFVLAKDGPVFIVDQDTKRRYRLSPGEAEFVPTGANQTWASLGDRAGSVYAIELSDQAVARDPGDAEILIVSNSFEIPQGDYDLNLIRDVVDGGEVAEVAGGRFPMVVFATAGAVDVSSTRAGESVRLGRGEGVVLRGDVTVRGRGDVRSTYVAGVIGAAVTGGQANPTPIPTREPAPTAPPTEPADEVEESPRSTPEPDEGAAATPTGSSVRIAVRLCRDEIHVANLDPRTCQRADGNFRLVLVAPDGTRLRLSDADRVGDTFVRWGGLDPGVYALIVGAMPDGYVTYSLDGFPCCPFDTGYVITVGEDVLIEGTLYLLQDFPPAVAVAAAPAPTVVPVAVAVRTDRDADGISDADELNTFGTSPDIVDSDGDTILDGIEAYGSNGFLTMPARADSDGDGVNDDIEIARGTSPTVAGSR